MFRRLLLNQFRTSPNLLNLVRTQTIATVAQPVRRIPVLQQTVIKRGLFKLTQTEERPTSLASATIYRPAQGGGTRIAVLSEILKQQNRERNIVLCMSGHTVGCMQQLESLRNYYAEITRNHGAVIVIMPNVPERIISALRCKLNLPYQIYGIQRQSLDRIMQGSDLNFIDFNGTLIAERKAFIMDGSGAILATKCYGVDDRSSHHEHDTNELVALLNEMATLKNRPSSPGK